MINNQIQNSYLLSGNQNNGAITGRPEEIERGFTPPPQPPKQQSGPSFTPERRKDLMRPTPLKLKLLTNKNDHDNKLLGEILSLISSINNNAYSPPPNDTKEAKIDWWDETPPTKNIENPQEQNLKKLDTAINTLIQTGQPKPLLMTLKFLSDYPFGTANTYFTKVLRQLQKCIPKIVGTDYIQEDVNDPTRGQIVTRNAVERLFKFFEKHFDIPVGVLSCQYTSDLPNLINDMVTRMKEGEFKGWATSNYMDLHMIPVFAIVKNNKVNVFIYDSIGHTFDDKNKPDLYGISHGFREILMRNPHLQREWKNKVAIHSYAEKRQNEGRGCWAFVVQDLRDLVEMHLDTDADSIVDFYSANAERMNSPAHNIPSFHSEFNALHLEPRRNSTPLRKDISNHFTAGKFIDIYEVNSLPPAMMKVTQSLKKIDKYCRQSEILSEENKFRPHSARRLSESGIMIPVIQDLGNLKETISQNTILNSTGDKQQNAYAGRMRFTYIVYLITSLWEEHNKPPTAHA